MTIDELVWEMNDKRPYGTEYKVVETTTTRSRYINTDNPNKVEAHTQVDVIRESSGSKEKIAYILIDETRSVTLVRVEGNTPFKNVPRVLREIAS